MDLSHRRHVDFDGPPTSLSPAMSGRRVVAPPGVRGIRAPRSAGLVQAVARLDASIDAAERAALARWIEVEYAQEMGDVPLGFVAMCHLGPPYVDHRLDLLHSIVDHFAPGDPMPEPYASARMLARSGAYAYVEVFASGELHAVRLDGSVA